MNRSGDGRPVGYVRSLVDLLMELRARAGSPSYREIARRIPSGLGERTSAGYVSEVMRGKRVPSGDMAAAIVRALRGDEACQQRARRYAEEGGTDKVQSRVRSAGQQRVVPRQLPAAVAHFAGRAGELATLTGLLRGRSGTGGTVVISAVSGTAGVGKTALGVYWAHRVADQFPDGQLYVNLRGFHSGGRAMEPAAAVRGFIKALGVPPERIPAGLDAQTALYRSLLNNKRILIVLDNARDAEQVRPLLPGTHTALVVVTSRNQLTPLIATDGAHPVTLDLLAPAEARELLERRLGPDRVAAEPQAVQQIITACARLPLALSIAAARAAQTGFPLATLATELSNTHGRLDALDAGDPATRVQAVFSWSYHTLSPPAARLFRLLGLHPGPDVSAAAAASLAGQPLSQIRPLLAELAHASMTTEHTPGRYSFHDLLAAYATDLSHTLDPDHERRAATGRLLDHYTHTAHTAAQLLYPARDPIPLPLDPPAPGTTPEQPTSDREARAWLDAEYPVLLTALQRADTGFDTHTWQLAWALTTFLYRRGHWHEMADAWQAAVTAASRLTNPAATAHAYRELGWADIRVGRYSEAHTHLHHALDLYIETGDQSWQANTRLTLSHLWEQQDQPEKALGHAQQALTLSQATDHRPVQATAFNMVGWCYIRLGDHTQALTYCQQALTLFQQTGDRWGEAFVWDSIGYAHHHLNHHTQAINCYQHALTLLRDLGDRYHETEILTHLGDTHHAADNPNAARTAWTHALDILTDLNRPDTHNLRTKLATLHHAPSTATRAKE